MADKIKAIQPMITVGGKIEKPCYSVTYYDTSDKQWHVGFSSFDFANVKKWLKEEFEVVAETADVAEVKRGKWEICCDGYYPYCSVCKAEPKNGVMSNYCPNCGADMRPLDKN